MFTNKFKVSRPKVAPYNKKFLSRTLVNIPLSELNQLSEESDSESDNSELVSSGTETQLNNTNNLKMSTSNNNANIAGQAAIPQIQAALPNQNQGPAAIVRSVFDSLRVPDAIKDLPRFDGNPRLLYDFINNVEEILSLISVADGTPYAQILLRAIRNKIEGQANEVLNMYGTSLNWEQIKENLILHYSDKRNETSLIRDLHNLRQGSSTVEKFYSEVIEVQATIFNHVQIHENDPNVVKAKRDLYSEMCLNAFLTGLKEPLGSTVRAMRPETLPIAFSYCVKEQNISYLRSPYHAGTSSSSNSNNRRNVPQNNPRLNAHSILHRPFNPHPRSFPNQRPSYNFRPFNQNPPINNTFNRINSFNPQSFNNRPFNQQSFNVRPSLSRPQQQTLPPPEPMDVSSGNTHLKFTRQNQPQSRQPQNNYFRQTGPPRVISEELFNISNQNTSIPDTRMPNHI